MVVSSGGLLKCMIFHINMPTYVNLDQYEKDMKIRIDTCVESLKSESDSNPWSIAFPVLGTRGSKYYPPDVTAKFMFKHVENWLLANPNQLKRVSFVVSPTDTESLQGI